MGCPDLPGPAHHHDCTLPNGPLGKESGLQIWLSVTRKLTDTLRHPGISC